MRDGDAIADHLGAYGRLLSAHIVKEDEVLYPWMDRVLTTAEVGELFSRFATVDEAAGSGFTDHYAALIAGIERSVESRKSRQSEGTTKKVEVER